MRADSEAFHSHYNYSVDQNLGDCSEYLPFIPSEVLKANEERINSLFNEFFLKVASLKKREVKKERKEAQHTGRGEVGS
jgi:hypothetical protein